MTDDELPTLPTDPKVIELGGANASRPCGPCGGDADYYVVVTNEMYNRREGAELDHDQWPVNTFLCRGCFTEAPRVTDWSKLG